MPITDSPGRDRTDARLKGPFLSTPSGFRAGFFIASAGPRHAYRRTTEPDPRNLSGLDHPAALGAVLGRGASCLGPVVRAPAAPAGGASGRRLRARSRRIAAVE